MKKFFSGLIIGLLLTTTVFASSEQIQAVFSDFNFVINGQVQKVQTKPLIYNGTSYLPVREVATLLGYDVDYKADTRTIELNNKGGNDLPSNKTMNTGELVQLLGKKYPEALNTIGLHQDGKLTFKDQVFHLKIDYNTLEVDIAPLIEAGILN